MADHDPSELEPTEAVAPDETGEFRRVDLATRDRVTTITATTRIALRRMWVAIAGLFLMCCLGGFFLWQNYQDVRDNARRLQASRISATFETCQESNDRHDRTVAAFRREFKRALAQIKDPAQRAQALDQRDANIRLINVFIPVHKDSTGRSTCLEFSRGRTRVDENG